MEGILFPVLAGIIGIAIGFFIAKMLERSNANKLIQETKKEASSIIKEAKVEAEAIKKDKILQAKEKFIELKSEHEKVILSREKKVSDVEKRIRDKESQVSSELDKTKKLNKQLETKEADFDYKLEFLEKKESEIEKMHKRHVDMLEQISGLSADEAKTELVASLKDEAKADAMSFIQDTVEEAKMTAQQEARKVVLNTIQRVGVEQAVENCVSVFNLESDDVKGRIIGREGRNIRALEAATGVEIIVDDTPEAIILILLRSCKKRNCKIIDFISLLPTEEFTLQELKKLFVRLKNKLEEEIIEVGKRTTIDLGIHGLHPELIRTGRYE